ncbi:MAG: diaminopimelate epimerase [Clostridiales bacterium]|nr:diaminopimelate epimerase [Clostridiales bacterium]
MKFTKMQGCGNDYVYVNCFAEKVENPSELAKIISDRHFGVGSDGLILIMPSETADCRMRMFNWDGSESEMCGNGVRCVGKYVHDRGIVNKDTITVETLAGIKILNLKLDDENQTISLTVDMGEPILKASDIPVVSEENPVKNLTLKAFDREFTFTCVSMGNPHAVTFIDNVDDFNIEKYGSVLETDEHFPKRANIEFVQIIDKSHLKMRVWERGTGETLACGTGTCATVVAAALNEKSDRNNVDVKLLGGHLQITWDEKDNHVYMTGPAEFSFDGVWEK